MYVFLYSVLFVPKFPKGYLFWDVIFQNKLFIL